MWELFNITTSINKNASMPTRYNIFKSPKKEKNEAVRFWMDYRSYDRLYSNQEKQTDSLENILSLYTIKNTISNFVKITSSKPVNVKYYGKDSSVDKQRTVTISSNLDDFDKVVGLSLHESSHISFSELAIYEEIFKACSLTSYPGVEQRAKDFAREYAKIISKILRTNNSKKIADMAQKLFLVILKDIINWIEDRRIDILQITKFPGYKQYYDKLYNHYFFSEITEQGLRSKLKRTCTFDSYAFRIINSQNDGTDVNALPDLDKILDLININNINKCRNNYDSAYLGLKVFEIVLKHCKDTLPTDPQKNPTTDKENREEQEQQKKEQEAEKEKAEAEQKLKDEKEEPEEDSEEEPEDGEELEIKEARNSADTDDEEDFDESEEDEEDENVEVEYEEVNEDDLEDKIKEIENLIRQEDKSNKEQISERIESQMDLLDSKQLDIKKTDFMGVNVLNINSVNEAVSKAFPKLFYPSPDYALKNAVNRGITKGKTLGRKLQIMNDERIITTIRKKNGSIDSRLLPEIGFGNTRIFTKTRIEEFNKLYIYLTLDSSGSMAISKWPDTLEMAAAMVEALSMVEGARVIVNTRATITMNEEENVFNMIIYDSQVNNITHIKKWWGRIRATGNTPEGLAFEASMKKILKEAKGTDSYFINISDGEPGCSATKWNINQNDSFSYDSDEAEEHTKKQVENLVKNNISVISYLVGSSGSTAFDKMYGKNAFYISITDINKIAQTLNKRFLDRKRISR